MSDHDYYEILEVHLKASQEVIERAYKTLIMKYHPDRNPGREEWATQKTILMNEAYGVIGNPTRRAEYDAQRKVAKPITRPPIKPSAPYQPGAGLLSTEPEARVYPSSGQRKRRAVFDFLGRHSVVPILILIGAAIVLYVVLRPMVAGHFLSLAQSLYDRGQYMPALSRANQAAGWAATAQQREKADKLAKDCQREIVKSLKGAMKEAGKSLRPRVDIVVPSERQEPMPGSKELIPPEPEEIAPQVAPRLFPMPKAPTEGR